MEIVKRQIMLSKRERFDILEIRNRSRISYFSYTYRIFDKTGNIRPIIRWDNFDGQVHYETFDSYNRLFKQEPCDFKDYKEILQLVKIFKHNLATMDISHL
jgi:hypothetical protein